MSDSELTRVPRPGISATLDSTHKYICRAGFLVVMMIVRRNLVRSHVREAKWNLEKALEKLGELHDWPNNPRV